MFDFGCVKFWFINLISDVFVSPVQSTSVISYTPDYLHMQYDKHKIPYIGKLSREKALANFVVCGYSQKFFRKIWECGVF